MFARFLRRSLFNFQKNNVRAAGTRNFSDDKNLVVSDAAKALSGNKKVPVTDAKDKLIDEKKLAVTDAVEKSAEEKMIVVSDGNEALGDDKMLAINDAKAALSGDEKTMLSDENKTPSAEKEIFGIPKKALLPGGGLEKLQGGIKEEKYFTRENLEKMTSIRQQGDKLDCEKCLDAGATIEKSLENVPAIEKPINTKAALRESCCLPKHKDCLEEAFFLGEQKVCFEKLQSKIAQDTITADPITTDPITTDPQIQATEEKVKAEDPKASPSNE